MSIKKFSDYSIINESYVDQTEENNVLIAEFIGFDMSRLESDGVIEGYKLPYEIMQTTFGTDELKFHKSWDWLIVVAQKISNSKTPQTPEGISNLKRYYYPIEDSIKTFHLELFYKSIINYIKWYNEENNKLTNGNQEV